MAFLEKGLMYSNNCLCYITPDKWLSKPFGFIFREKCMIPRLNKIVHTGNKTFESATVDAIITLFLNKSNSISAYKFGSSKEVIFKNEQYSNCIAIPYYIDALFNDNYKLITKIESGNPFLIDVAECENACATHDAYELSPYVINLLNSFDAVRESKLVNTGTIDKFSNKWGMKELTYLGTKYHHPIVDRQIFIQTLGQSYARKAFSKKIILKGLNLLDGFIDFQGEFIPGKTTLVICADDPDLLKYLCGILNSKLAIFYIKSKYASSSYCGGITFSKDMINNFPLPQDESAEKSIITVVENILKEGYILDYEKELNETIYKAYNLTYDEVKIIDPATPITREEYEK